MTIDLRGEGLEFRVKSIGFIMNPRSLEHAFRIICAGIP